MQKFRFSWELFNQFAKSIAHEIEDEGKPELIIGMARGGLPFAVALSHLLNVPMTSHAMTTRHSRPTSIELATPDAFSDFTRDRNILIADDIFDTGHTVNQVIASIDSKQIRATSLVRNPGIKINCETVDGFLNMANEWIVFPWEVE